MLDSVNVTAKITLKTVQFQLKCTVRLSLNHLHDSVQSGLLHGEHLVVSTRIKIHS